VAYLLDANVFIEAKNRYYGFDFCPAFWEWLDASNADGIIYSIDKVRDELIGYGDELAELAKARGGGFFLRPDEALVPRLQQLSQWASGGAYEPAAVTTFLESADYYLVAHARAHDFVVVTHEVPADSGKRIKIPNACLAVGVRFVTTFEMLRTERARFVLA
jgi:hypothetical protein